MKISQKDLDLLVSSMMQEIYDYNYIQTEREKIRNKSFNEFKKTKAYKNFVKVFDDNPDISSINVYDSIYEGTIAYNEASRNCTTCIHRNSIDKDLQSRFMYATIKVDYPSDAVVQAKLRATLAIELIGGNDLKKALADVTKAIKKEFHLA